MSRAASIALQRQQFDEREKAKDAARVEQENKKAQKEAVKKGKREESRHRKSEQQARRNEELRIKKARGSLTQDDKRAQQDAINAELGQRPPLQRTKTGGTSKGRAGGAGKEVRNQWQVFVMKLKTWWLKLKRKMGGHPSTKRTSTV